MTLVHTPAPLNPTYSYPCIHAPSTETHRPLAPASGLSWLQPGSAPSTSTSQKYRTLASIQLQTRQQRLSALENSHSQDVPLSPSIKPTPLDTLRSYSPHSSHPRPNPQTGSASSIASAIQDMDNSHGTCFLTWIHNPANIDYISLRLRPLCLEYPLMDVANVLRWIGADWSSTDCKALFRAVTQSWDQGKRRMLAFLLIRDEEMRQKAQSRLVEFAQKPQPMRRSQQSQSPQLLLLTQQNRQPEIYHHNHHHHHHHQQQQQPWRAQARTVSKQRPTPGYRALSMDMSVASTKEPIEKMTTLEDIVAASIISGEDIVLPETGSWAQSMRITTEESLTPTIATTTTTTTTTNTNTSIRQHRFSPY